VRIRTTTRPSTSPHPIATTIATTNSVQSVHQWAPSPAVPVFDGPEAISFGRDADRAPDATTIPLARLRHATGTDGQVSA
jgi:hypothetical protein